MLKMFISGSIANNTIPDEVIKSVDVSMDKNYVILVGDAKGVDKNIKDNLQGYYQKVTAPIIPDFAGFRNRRGARHLCVHRSGCYPFRFI